MAFSIMVISKAKLENLSIHEILYVLKKLWQNGPNDAGFLYGSGVEKSNSAITF